MKKYTKAKPEMRRSLLWEPREIRDIAVAAKVDAKTVIRHIDGVLPMRERNARRIDEAMRALGCGKA
jgi:hypothetical protein